MKRSDDRILSSHTGSVQLPPRDDHSAPELPSDRAEAKEAVRAVVDKQIEVGLDVINDGDLGAGLALVQSFHEFFTGVEKRPSATENRRSPRGVPDVDMETYAEYYAQHPMLPFDPGVYVCTDAIGPGNVDSLKWGLETLKEVAEGKGAEELFMCFISPGWIQEWVWNEHYRTEEEFVFAISEALKPYYKAVVDAGLILQIDAPDIPDNWSWDRWTDVNAYRKNLEMRLEATSNAISGLTEEQVRLPFCWGSWPGPHSVS